jgi:hypothetical protein
MDCAELGKHRSILSGNKVCILLIVITKQAPSDRGFLVTDEANLSLLINTDGGNFCCG